VGVGGGGTLGLLTRSARFCYSAVRGGVGVEHFSAFFFGTVALPRRECSITKVGSRRSVARADDRRDTPWGRASCLRSGERLAPRSGWK